MDGTAGGELWRLTIEHSPIGMCLVGLDGRLLMVNRAMCDMLGHDAAWLTRRGFQEVTHPDDLEADLELVRAALVGERDAFRMRKRYLHADGHVVWGDLSAALVRGPDGEPLHFISQILDVTEQREVELRAAAASAAVEREREALAAIFETVTVGLLLVGADGRYERMNRRHAETMRLPFPDGHDGIAGQPGEVYHLDGHTPLTREEMPSHRAAHGEEFDDFTYWVGRDPLTRAAFSVTARQVRGPDGVRRGAALAYQEITPLVRALQARDALVASVSHELRTPLTPVLGHLELLCEQDDLPAATRAQLRVVQRNAQRLQSLVADLLHVAEVSEGRFELHRAPVDLVALVRDAVEGALSVAARTGIELTTQAPRELLADLDAQRIRQVVDNLLSNAIKYTGPRGAVLVDVRRVGAEVVLAVTDSGMGIAPDEVDRVFTRFFRGGEAVDRQIPGSGLGLEIVRSIVAAHRGTVSVESELGRGSTFRVTLPMT